MHFSAISKFKMNNKKKQWISLVKVSRTSQMLQMFHILYSFLHTVWVFCFVIVSMSVASLPTCWWICLHWIPWLFHVPWMGSRGFEVVGGKVTILTGSWTRVNSTVDRSISLTNNLRRSRTYHFFLMELASVININSAVSFHTIN